MQGSSTPEFTQQRRRSTRIDVSVPVTIRGIDLLSQPFEERTQTLSLNTYGCRYPSKHHLPKNTWITLEVPGQGDLESPHRVRARVVWIQKPRSIREPFQVSVELESPSNIWSVTSAPNDWRFTPEYVQNSAPEQRDQLFGLDVTRPEEFSRENGLVAGARPSEEEPASGPDRAPDASTSEEPNSEAPSSQPPSSDADLARLHKEAFAEAVGLGFGVVVPEEAEQGSLESPLLREINAHIENQAARAVEDAAQRASTTWHESAEAFEKKRLAETEASLRTWLQDFEAQRTAAGEEIAQRATKEIAGARDEIAAHFTSQMAWVREELRSDLKEEFTSHIDQMRKLVSELELGAESLRAEASAATSASARMAQIQAALEAVEASAEQRVRSQNETPNQEAATLEQLSDIWRDRLNGQMSQARTEWEELLQSSLDSAAQKLVSRFAAGSQAALEGAEKSLEERVSHFKDPVTSAIVEAQQVFERLRGSLEADLHHAHASLGEIERSAHRMRDMASQIDAATHDAINQLHRRVESALEAQVAELQRTAEMIASALPQRIQPAIDSSVQQFMDRTLAEVDARLNPRLERVPELIRELDSREIETEESLRLYRERLRQAAEANRREAQEQLGSLLSEVHQSFDHIRNDVMAHWNDELNATASRAAQAAGEELSRSEEINLQQAQERIGALTNESLQRAEGIFEERTRQAMERLEQIIQNRHASFADEMRGQLEAVNIQAHQRAQAALEQSAGATLAAFEQRTFEVSARALEDFSGSAEANIAEKTKRAEVVAEDIRKNIEEVARMLLDRYCDQMAAHSEQQIAEARESHARELSVAIEDARREREAQQSQWSDSLHHLNEESLRNYENHLHHTNEIWVDAALQKLNDKGEQTLTTLSHAHEQALRSSLVNIFEEIAGALRQKIGEGTPPSGSSRPQGDNTPSSSARANEESSSASTPPPSAVAQNAGHSANA